LPLQQEDLRFGKSGIPASVLAVAVRAYELNNPGSSLREDLTRMAVLRAAC